MNCNQINTSQIYAAENKSTVSSTYLNINYLAGSLIVAFYWILILSKRYQSAVQI